MRHNGFKAILVSPDIHRRLADIGKKRETFNEIITDLIELRNKNAIRSEPMLGEASTHSKSSTQRTRIGDPKPNG